MSVSLSSNEQLLIFINLCFFMACLPSDVAREREVEGDIFLHDAGQGLCFKPGTFDSCIR